VRYDVNFPPFVGQNIVSDSLTEEETNAIEALRKYK